MEAATPAPKRTLTAVKVILSIAAVLVTIAGFQLFVLTEHTDRYFAWTIKSAMTAAFIGAAYWSALPMVVGGARLQLWAQTRASFFSPMVFTISMLIATLLHLDSFHIHASDAGFPKFAAWAWIVVYATVPVAEIIILAFQLRAPGGDPPRTATLSGPLRAVVAAQGAIMLLFGIAFFAAPLGTATLWPWKLTALTALVVGGWLLGLGVAGLQAVFENDWSRVTAPLGSYLAFGVLQAIALVRYSSALDWTRPGGALYTAFVASIIVVAAWAMFSRLAALRR